MSSTPMYTERSRPLEMSVWRPRRPRSRRWSVSSSFCFRTGWSAARSRRVHSSSAAAALQVAPLLQRRRYRRPRAGNLAVHACLLILSFLFLFPLILLISASLSSETDISTYGFSLVPRTVSFAAYQYILNDPSQILTAYAVTVTVTLVGTGAGVLIMAMLAYPLSRADFSLRRPLSFFVFFTLLFSGGLVPLYILLTHYCQIRDRLLALILPSRVMPWSVLLLHS